MSRKKIIILSSIITGIGLYLTVYGAIYQSSINGKRKVSNVNNFETIELDTRYYAADLAGSNKRYLTIKPNKRYQVYYSDDYVFNELRYSVLTYDGNYHITTDYLSPNSYSTFSYNQTGVVIQFDFNYYLAENCYFIISLFK